jgi:diguanylate cyclase (GGDEF)-like protein
LAEHAPQALVVIGCLALIGAVGVVQHRVGPEYSVAVLYLLPVAAAARWAGRIQGVLLSLAAALVWHEVSLLQDPTAPSGPRFWNECAYFGFFATTSWLVSALTISLDRERSRTRTDPVTGAASGRGFYETVHLELERCGRTRRPVTLAFLDLDGFKQLNDRLGRTTGDRLLRRAADVLRRNLRPCDVVGRLGGDDFGLLLPETDGPAATALLARLQKLLPQLTAECGCPVTASIGAATFVRPPDADRAARYVAAQLAAAKAGGRGRLEHEVVTGTADGPVGLTEERRAAPRQACCRVARVCCLGASGVAAEYGLVHDLSAEGVGLHTERPFPEGAVLTVEALNVPGARPLLGRVVRSSPREGGWSLGCALSARLDGGDLQQWLPGPAEQHAPEAPAPSRPLAAKEEAADAAADQLPETVADLQISLPSS